MASGSEGYSVMNELRSGSSGRSAARGRAPKRKGPDVKPTNVVKVAPRPAGSPRWVPTANDIF